MYSLEKHHSETVSPQRLAFADREGETLQSLAAALLAEALEGLRLTRSAPGFRV